ncbi:hypothetical protein GSI_08572 [Ganoderma sinense ZZ0214-1]|uniref:Uncharacterized protein n=1 Tax=Ganoderma sinense ZZ0214-1 TaxID=1077348 RepID=A0A2G8S474_9APHY|nr:hypothetical protein GSI_08572 [Ganoderma sinense ZZ0214-1]
MINSSPNSSSDYNRRYLWPTERCGRRLPMALNSTQTAASLSTSPLPPASASSVTSPSRLNGKTITGFALLGVGGLAICLAFALVLYAKRRTTRAPVVRPPGPPTACRCGRNPDSHVGPSTSNAARDVRIGSNGRNEETQPRMYGWAATQFSIADPAALERAEIAPHFQRETLNAVSTSGKHRNTAVSTSGGGGSMAAQTEVGAEREFIIVTKWTEG